MAVVSGILHETGALLRLFAALCLVGLAPAAAPAADALFDDDAILDVRLAGPLATISRNRADETRQEHPFTLRVAGADIPLTVRVRGKSRIELCDFPPLRLRFEAANAAGTLFAGQRKLKLVTHCRSDKEHYENNLLDEYTAYRMFNLLSETSYRARLLRITYEDSDSKLRHLDRPYHAFLIESDDGLADRLGASVVELPGILYSRLNTTQTTRMAVFQYLIGNNDWSFVATNDEDTCCHNVDLLEKDDELYPVPFDFDLSGLVNAKYARPAAGVRARKVTTRVYRGYCRSTPEDVAAAVEDIVALREKILGIAGSVPVVGDERAAARVKYIDRFFEEAVDDRKKLLKRFERDCVGRD